MAIGWLKKSARKTVSFNEMIERKWNIFRMKTNLETIFW
jgi:hypothetical protein